MNSRRRTFPPHLAPHLARLPEDSLEADRTTPCGLAQGTQFLKPQLRECPSDGELLELGLIPELAGLDESVEKRPLLGREGAVGTGRHGNQTTTGAPRIKKLGRPRPPRAAPLIASRPPGRTLGSMS